MQAEIDVIKAENLILETSVAKSSGIGFSEVMSGFIHVADDLDGDKKEDYEIAANTGKSLCEAARFLLSVKTWNTETSEYIVSIANEPGKLISASCLSTGSFCHAYWHFRLCLHCRKSLYGTSRGLSAIQFRSPIYRNEEFNLRL